VPPCASAPTRCWLRSGSPNTANSPPVILADEQTGTLNSAASEQVFRILR
jgi:hypothetical protein